MQVGSCTSQMENMKEEVSQKLKIEDDPLHKIDLIDTLERLGIAHNFEEEIEAPLLHLYRTHGLPVDDNLYRLSLSFRLFRQHGFNVSADVFIKFKNETGRFNLELRDDIKGMMSLYEASQLGGQGEDILDEAHDFTYEHLKASVPLLAPTIAERVEHCLQCPLHKSLPRFEARRFIETQAEEGVDTMLIQLAKLDFNFVQSLHLTELEEVARWWKDLGLVEQMNLARGDPSLWFMWSLAMLPEPKFSTFRIELAKIIGLIYIIDDIFDVYGSLDQLVLLTKSVHTWNLDTADQLPVYMKRCLISVFEVTDEIGNSVLRKHGLHVLPKLRKTWASLCKAFLVEAEWFRSGEVPKADHYLVNAIISTGVHVVLVHAFFAASGVTEASIRYLDKHPGFTSCPALILRLWDDLGCCKEEKHAEYDGSYIEYYMKEHPNSSLEVAREHVLRMISDAWKRFNDELMKPNPLPSSFKKACLNSMRMVRAMYDYDKVGRLSSMQEHLNALLVQSIPA